MTRLTDDELDALRTGHWPGTAGDLLAEVDALRAEVESLTTMRGKAQDQWTRLESERDWINGALSLCQEQRDAAVARAEQAEARIAAARSIDWAAEIDWNAAHYLDVERLVMAALAAPSEGTAE